MSSFLNRLKNLKPGSLNSNNHDGDTASISSFDEEGFLCPVCHRKFADTTGLEHHYLQAHSQEPLNPIYESSNGNRNHHSSAQVEDPMQEATLWKEQFLTSEESRMAISSDLMQQRQRVGDLEEELDVLKKQLRAAQSKVIDQSKEIGNLKASKDVHDAQIAMFTEELLSTQDELKQKRSQVDTLCNDLIPRPSNDDVDVLKHELIGVQQRMNELALDKEQEIERLNRILHDCRDYAKQFDQLETKLNQYVVAFDDIVDNQTSAMENELYPIKHSIVSIRERKQAIETACTSMRTHLDQNQTEIEQLKQSNSQLHVDLDERVQSNERLAKELQTEQEQSNAYRVQLDTLTQEIHELETSLEELKQEKNQFLLSNMEDDKDTDGQDLVRRLTKEKEQSEQQTKDLRKQIKQLNKEKKSIQGEFDVVSKDIIQVKTEKDQLKDEQKRLQDEIATLKQHLDDLGQSKEKQISDLTRELSAVRDESASATVRFEQELSQANETIEHQRQEVERLENEWKNIRLQLTEEIDQLKQLAHEREELFNETKQKLESAQQDNEASILAKDQIIAELQSSLEQKKNDVERLSTGLRRSTDLLRGVRAHIERNIHTTQMHLLELIEQSQQESQSIRARTLEEISEGFRQYLVVVQTMHVDHQGRLEKQLEEEQQRAEKRLHEMASDHDELKLQLETKLGELNTNLLQVSESLSQTTQEAERQREKFQQQIASTEEELSRARADYESRAKKHEMQVAALTENLATVRSELKTATEKLVQLEQVRTEKDDLATRLSATEEERQAALGRSLASESKNEKLVRENDQLSRKISDLEAALKEIAREYQVLQIQANRASERRWLSDSDARECMKCRQTFTLTQRKHHCRCCGNIFCDACSSQTAVVAAASKKPQRVCDQCFQELTS